MPEKKQKATAKRRKPRTTRKAGSRRKRGSVRMAGFQGAFMEIAKGVAGAVIASKLLPRIPVDNPKAKYAIGTALGAVLAIKGGKELAAVGIGAGIASGTMLAAEFMPNLLTAGAPATVGRVTSETERRMKLAAARIREGLAGMRDRTVVGTGGGGNYPAVAGDRDRTIVGSGDYTDILH